jgi:hypothetical protein
MRERTEHPVSAPPYAREHSGGGDMTLYLLGAVLIIILLLVYRRSNTKSTPAKSNSAKPRKPYKRKTNAESRAEGIKEGIEIERRKGKEQ